MAGYPSSIARAIEVSHRHFPAQTGEMETVLPVLLGPLLPAGDSARWRLSPLTDGGFPFELTLSTAGDGPRYTMEVGPADTAPAERLARALAMLAELGSATADHGMLDRLDRWQAMGELRFGAWLGARHGAAGSAYKLYTEVPAEAQPDVTAYLCSRLGRPPGLPGRRQEVQLLGWYPASGDLEVYFRVYDLRPWELGALMSPVDLAAQAPAVLAIFEDVFGRPFGQRLPGRLFGYSYGVPAAGSGRAATFSFFSFCEALARDDAAIRRRLRDHWQRQGVGMDYYAELSEPTAGHRGRWNHHGLLGVTVAADATPVTHVGLRPPEVA
jgi:hypothetical protein